MAHHRVPVLNTGLRRFPDPERSSDPKVQQLLGQLAVLEIAPPPRAHFRAELRAQLVAVAPRLVVEGVPDLVKHTPESLTKAEAEREPSAACTAGGRARRLRLGRPLAIVGTGLVVAVLALGGTVWLSRNALPGDTLYGVKRTAESVQYSFTSGTDARAKEQLHFASTRAREVQGLLGNATALALGDGANAAGGINAHTADLITKALGNADSNVQQAARMLGTEAVQQQSVQPLAIMTHWLPGQKDRLSAIVDRIPDGTLHERAVQSQQLLDQVSDREIAIAKVSGCSSCLTGQSHDQLGPNPTASRGAAGAQPNSVPGGVPSITAGTVSSAGAVPGLATPSVAPTSGSGVRPGRGLPTGFPTKLPSYTPPKAPTTGPVASLSKGLSSLGNQLSSAANGAGNGVSSALNGAGSAVNSVVNDVPVVGGAVNSIVNTQPSPTQSCVVNASILGLPVNVLC